MNPVTTINQTVDVVASFCAKPATAHRAATVLARPLKMRWHGREISFRQLGLCHPVYHGRQLVYVFGMSDGANDYSLEFSTTTLQWTLVSIIDGGSL